MKNTLSIALIILLLTGCAGMLVSRDAREAFQQGLALFHQGRYEKAIPYFERSREYDPEYADAYLYLGRSYLNLGKLIEAIQPLRTAYQLAPEDTGKEAVNLLIDALIGGALTEFKKGNYSGSVNYLKEGLDVDPNSAMLREELVKTLLVFGSVLLSEGNASEAVNKFSEAVDMAPDNMEGYLGLAKAFIQKGDVFDALKIINSALQRASTDTEKSQFKNLLP
jgi:tetratricopeptide (TPR) repeat protein